MPILNFKKIRDYFTPITKGYYLNIEDYPYIKVSKTKTPESLAMQVPEEYWKTPLKSFTVNYQDKDAVPESIEESEIMGHDYTPFPSFKLEYRFSFGVEKLESSSFFNDTPDEIMHEPSYHTSLQDYAERMAVIFYHLQKTQRLLKKIDAHYNHDIVSFNMDGIESSMTLENFFRVCICQEQEVHKEKTLHW